MNTKNIISLCAAVGAISLIGCQSTTTTASSNDHSSYTKSTTSKKMQSKSVATVAPKTIECGRFIRNIIAGKNYTGQEFTMYGVALNASDDGRVNVGTRAMFRDGQFDTFVSVYDVPKHVKPGSLVQFNVKVDSTHTGTMPSGQAFVVVEAEYID